ncbi:hypothetical protein SDC9_150587 [bioreactor metagenome]|uniref:Uncharacterized protein n=1 Tax=bioreactor metagenome TaxID=1076179 RepID=A0A645EQC6_9ZZZZ
MERFAKQGGCCYGEIKISKEEPRRRADKYSNEAGESTVRKASPETDATKKAGGIRLGKKHISLGTRSRMPLINGVSHTPGNRRQV